MFDKVHDIKCPNIISLNFVFYLLYEHSSIHFVMFKVIRFDIVFNLFR